MRHLNVLIGSNGAGKSNFVDFFRLLESMVVGNLSGYALARGADSLFYNGPKETPEIFVRLAFGINGYEFSIAPSADETVFISHEASAKSEPDDGGLTVQRGGKWIPLARWKWRAYDGARPEARLVDWSGTGGISAVTGSKNVCWHIHDAIASWRVYHFHDTSAFSPLRRSGQEQDVDGLRNDGSNIGPFLHHLRMNHNLVYERIVSTVRLIAPYFDDFVLTPRGSEGSEAIRLQWRQKQSNFPFTAAHLSDGTLRFIALITALLQPYPPSTIIIDEPELGLHPFALNILSGVLFEASQRTQVVVATQSPTLLENLDPEDVIVVDHVHGESVFRRLDRESLGEWLEEYSLPELWQKNVLSGGPQNGD